MTEKKPRYSIFLEAGSKLEAGIPVRGKLYDSEGEYTGWVEIKPRRKKR